MNPTSLEADFIRWVRRRLPAHPALDVGPGDDAAVLRLDSQAGVVLSSDLLTDGVDFRLDEIDPRRAGRKALAVNLSDLAAMAAKPVAAVVSLALPRQVGGALAKQLIEGMLPLADAYQLAIAGGDTNSWDGPLVISVAIIGESTDRGPLRRKGAQPGDAIVVTGEFGGSILAKHFDFEPRVNEAISLHERFQLSAGMDVSDGLSLDLSRLAEESGCGVEIDLDAIPIAAAARELAADLSDGRTALDHALGDGEDFELILAMPADEASRLIEEQPLDVALCRIGTCIDELGLWCRDSDGMSPLIAGNRLGTPMSELLFDANDLDDTNRLGAALADCLPPGTTVGLCGTLGAGKTHLVKAVAVAAGVDPDDVTSPTFVICREYHGRRQIYHFDAYRIRDDDEFLELGPEEMFESDAITLIEWADRVAACLPPDRLEIHIDPLTTTARRFRIRSMGEGYAPVVDALRQQLGG